MRFFLSLLFVLGLALPAQSTTVICDGEYLASDSQMSYDRGDRIIHMDWTKKLHYIRGYWVGAAGHVSDIKKFCTWLDGKGEYPYRGTFQCMVICKKGCYIYTEDSRVPDFRFYPCGVGTGAQAALSGYLAGKSIVDAVKYAETQDKYSSGRVQVIKLK